MKQNVIVHTQLVRCRRSKYLARFSFFRICSCVSNNLRYTSRAIFSFHVMRKLFEVEPCNVACIKACIAGLQRMLLEMCSIARSYPSPITRMCSLLRTREHATYTLCSSYALRRSDSSAQKMKFANNAIRQLF